MQIAVQSKSKTLLGVTDLTLVAPLKRGLIPAQDSRSYESRLVLLLRTLSALRTASLEAEPTPLIEDLIDGIRAIHSFRLAIVGQAPARMVLLSVAFDGGWEPYMRRIWRDLGPLLDVIFCNCDGYLHSSSSSYADYIGWVRSAQVSTEFFYNATSLSVDDLHYLRRMEQERIDGHAAPKPKGTILDQGLAAVTALYRLTDMYPPVAGSGDGEVLRRAAWHLLRDFHREIAEAPGREGRTPIEAAALRWFKEAAPAPQRAAMPSEFQPSRVQGGILQSYPERNHACLLLIELRHAAAVCSLLAHLKPRICSGEQQDAKLHLPNWFYANVGFTPQGLQLAGVEGATMEEMPVEFREGMAARASILGDLKHNHPSQWVLPLRNWGTVTGARPERVELSSVHVVVQLTVCAKTSQRWMDLVEDKSHPLRDAVEALDKALVAEGVHILSVQSMQRLPNSQGFFGRDHFDFQDGISQPVLKDSAPRNSHSDVVPLGDLLLGYQNSRRDPPMTGRLWDDSTFLVVRKLRQNVDALQDLECAHATLPPNLLRSRMMGRTPAGDAMLLTPQSVTPRRVTLVQGNDFNYADDPEGDACPLQSHVRRANPRTHSPMPRILRRGMSYGSRNGSSERGLIFMAYNASIAEQFEVIQSWLSGGNSHGDRSYSALRDPFLGVAQDSDPATFVFKDDQGKEHRVPLPADDPLVTLEWGLYLFVPSMKALDELHERAREAANRSDTKKNQRRDAERSILAQHGARIIAGLRRIEQLQGGDAAKVNWKIALEDLGARMTGASRAVWAAVRELHGGVLRTPYGVLVCSKDRVMEVLGDKQRNYTATGYAERMGRSFGEIYLGMDDGDEYRQESRLPNQAVQQVSRYGAFAEAFKQTQESVQGYLAKAADADIVVDVKDIVDDVLARLSKVWFGIPDGKFVVAGWHLSDDALPTCPGHFHSPSRYMFQPQPGQEAADAGERHGKALRTAVRNFVDAHHRAGTKPWQRLAWAVCNAFPGDPDKQTRTLIGVMMGFLPTVDGNLRSTLYEWVNDRSLWDHQSAYLADDWQHPFERSLEILLPPLRRTLQLRPVPELVWRTARERDTLGGVAVNAGDKVVVSIVSATQQFLLDEEDDLYPLFGGDRGLEGHPTHACPGYKMAMGVMLGMLAGLLGSAELRPTLSPMALRLRPLRPLHGAPAGAAVPSGPAKASSAASAPVPAAPASPAARMPRKPGPAA